MGCSLRKKRSTFSLLVAMITLFTLTFSSFATVYAEGETPGTQPTVVDKTAEPVKDGLHVAIDYPHDQLASELVYIPEFKFNLLDSSNKVVASATGNANNFDRENYRFNITFGVKEFKLGDKFKIELASSDSVVKDFTTFSFIVDDKFEYTNGEIQTVSKTTKCDVVAFRKMHTNAKGESFMYPYGSKFTPVKMTLKTDISRVAVKLINQNNAPVKNEEILITSHTGETFKVKSDADGLAWVDTAKVDPVFHVDMVNKSIETFNDDGSTSFSCILPVLNMRDKTYRNVISFAVPVRTATVKTDDNTVADTSNSSIDVNMTTSANTELGKGWSDVELALTNKEGNEYTGVVNLTENKIVGLPDGQYTIKVVASPYSKVTSIDKTVTVTKGKGNFKLAVEPKYLLSVEKRLSDVPKPYKFKILNIDGLEDKEYKGTEATLFAVTPGDNIIVQDVEDTNMVLSASIVEDSFLTRLILGDGLVVGSSAINPHTADYKTILFTVGVLLVCLIIMLGRSYIKAPIMPNRPNKGKRFLSIFLVFAISLPLFTGLIATKDTSVAFAGDHAGVGGEGTPITGADVAKVGTHAFAPSNVGITVSLTEQFTNLTKDAGVSDLYSHDLPAYEVNQFFVFNSSGAQNTFRNSAKLAWKNNIWYVMSGESPFGDGAKSSAYTSLYSNDNDYLLGHKGTPFADFIYSAVGGRSLADSGVGDALRSAFKGLEKDKDKMDVIVQSYCKILEKENPAQANSLWEAYERGEEIRLVINTLGCFSTSNTLGSGDTYYYANIVDVANAVSDIKGYGVNNKEWEIFKNAGTCGGAGKCTDPYCASTGHLPWSMNGGNGWGNTVSTNLHPVTSAVGGYPYGGWGFMVLQKEPEADNYPEVSAEIQATVVSKAGIATGASFTVPVPGWSEADHRRLNDLSANATISYSGAIKYGGKSYTINSTGNIPSKFIDTGDKANIKLSPLAPTGSPSQVNVTGTGDGFNFKFKTHVPNTTKQYHFFLGGKQEGASRDLDEDLAINKANANKGVWEGVTRKYGGGEGEFSNAKLIVPLTVIDEEFDKQKVDISEIEEWRLSKYWKEISEVGNKNYSEFTLNLLPDDSRSHKTARLNRSGSVKYKVQLAKQLPSWLTVKPTWLKPSNGLGSIALNDNNDKMYVTGKTYAVKENGTIAENKIASWVSNTASTSIKGIGKTNKTSGASTPTVTKNQNIELKIVNPYASQYVHHRKFYKHRTETSEKKDSSGKTLGTINTEEVNVREDASILAKVKDTIVENTQVTILESDGMYYKIKYSKSGKSKEGYVYKSYITKNTTSRSVCECYVQPYNPKYTYKNAIYKKIYKFYNYVASSSATAGTIKTSSTRSGNTYTESTQSSVVLKVVPEVLMQYATTTGKQSAVFTAGTQMRSVKPSAYHSATLSVGDGGTEVTGSSIATDSRAKSLASRLGVKSILYKGSAVSASSKISGSLVAKSYVLDIGNSALKKAWNPSTTYNSDKIAEGFLSKVASKTSGGWVVKYSTESGLVIGGKNIGSTKSSKTEKGGATSSSEHKIIVRGGKVVSTGGLSADVVSKMGLNTVFGSFARNQGASLKDSKFASLASSMRNGAGDIKVGKGWYSEDTTVFVVREYTTTFKVPDAIVFSEKIPQTIAGIETPTDVSKYFSNGVKGGTYTTVTHNGLGISSGFTTNNKYGVPNVSILDTTK